MDIDDLQNLSGEQKLSWRVIKDIWSRRVIRTQG